MDDQREIIRKVQDMRVLVHHVGQELDQQIAYLNMLEPPTPLPQAAPPSSGQPAPLKKK